MDKYQEIAQMLDANAIQNTVDAYIKGRADKYAEITSEYMLLTEEQLQEIKADIIDEFVEKMKKYWGGLSAMDEIEQVAEQLRSKHVW